MGFTNSKLISAFFKVFYWPMCRGYGRYIIGNKPAGEFYRKLCSFQFYLIHRYWPNFSQPRSFNEKLWSRMLHDRNPILTLISDKLLVREFVLKKIGKEFLIPLLWQGANPDEIPFNKLPARFVVKTNHGCGYVIIVDDRMELDKKNIIRQLKKWLGTNFGQDTYLGIGWAYKNIKPKIMIEAFMDDEGKPPVDYKFYCFSGRVEFLTVHYDRFGNHKTRSFDRNFEPYDFRYDFAQWEGECLRPKNFEKMICLSEALSEDFDFMRVDLYNINNSIYFSELTPYPGGVSTKFLPLNRDYILGEKWQEK